MANLSPELLALLQQQNAATYNKNNLSPLLQGGQYYQPQYAGGGGGGEGGFDNPGTMTGYLGYDQSWADGGDHTGEKGQFYNADGTFSNDYDYTQDGYKNLMLFLAAAGGLAMLPGGAVSTLSGGGAGAAVPGVGEAGWGADLGMEGLAGATPSSVAGTTLAGTGGMTAAGGAATGGGLLSSLGGASSLLGPAATVLGGLAGSQGQKTEQTSERKTDPRVDPYLFGDGANPGLLGYTQQLLARQMAPGGLAGYDQMQKVGQGLLSAPVAGNGFNLFSGRR